MPEIMIILYYNSCKIWNSNMPNSQLLNLSQFVFQSTCREIDLAEI